MSLFTFALLTVAVSSFPYNIESARFHGEPPIDAPHHGHGRGPWKAPVWSGQSSATSAPVPTSTSVVNPVSTGPSGPKSTGLGDTYTLYKGDGTTAEGWPAKSSWVNFDTMWENNLALIRPSCANLQEGVANDSPQEIDDIRSAITSVSASTGVPLQFILAIMIEESKGCVRVETTFSDHPNPGLMQSFDGRGTCNRNGVVQNPCPASEVTQMIKDGTSGTAHGPGLVQDLNATDATDVSRYYKAARIYNSGSIPANGNLDGPGSTRCYASDIANRLTGWVLAESKCNLD